MINFISQNCSYKFLVTLKYRLIQTQHHKVPQKLQTRLLPYTLIHYRHFIEIGYYSYYLSIMARVYVYFPFFSYFLSYITSWKYYLSRSIAREAEIFSLGSEWSYPGSFPSVDWEWWKVVASKYNWKCSLISLVAVVCESFFPVLYRRSSPMSRLILLLLYFAHSLSQGRAFCSEWTICSS